MLKIKKTWIVAFWSAALITTGCNAPSTPEPGPGISNLPDTSLADPVNPPVAPTTPPTNEAPVPSPSPAPAPVALKNVLLYNGAGVSTSDWQNTEKIVKSMNLSYTLANAAQLETISLEDLAGFGMIIVPGGSGGTIYQTLSTATRLRLREAVREHGVSYVGFCAGAWVAVGPEAETMNTASYGFALAKGAVLSLFHPNGQTPTADIVPVTFADSTVRHLVWWGGPVTPEWRNGVIARYDTGKPAISQTWAGKGLVIVTGPHPEAPQGWWATAGTDPDGLDYDITKNLIQAALTKEPLPTF